MDFSPFPTTGLEQAIQACLSEPESRFTEDRWSIHGTTLALHSDHPQVRAVAAHLLGAFPAAPGAAQTDARLCLTTTRRWRIPPDAAVLPPSSNEIVDVQASYGLTGTFARAGEVNFLEMAPLGGAVYDMSAGQALGYVSDPQAYRPWVIGHLFLMTLALELMRGRGLYWVHAAAVAHQGRAALMVGQTGAGKTTTCLALVRGGFTFLAEDRIFLRPDGAALELLSFPKHIAITRHTVELLPWLRDRLPEPPQGHRKHEAAPADLFPEALADRAAPGVILFPRVGSGAASEARPVAQAAALQRLLPNSLLASQAGVTARHFEALTQLVEQSQCYDLLLGPNVDALPGLVRGLLNRA